MKFNFTAQVLLATITLYSASVLPVGAQTYPATNYPPTPSGYPATNYPPTPGRYPATNYPPAPSGYPATNYPPAQAPTYSPARPPVQTSTNFICGKVSIYPAALVQVNGRTLQSPLIVFQTASDNLTPEQRCNDVTQRMNRAVVQNGGKLSNLLLTTGKVNSQAVICFVNTAETCNSSNVILTLLRRENAKDPGKVLSRIVRFGRAGGGINVLENGGIEGGEEIIPQAVSLEEAVNQLASESNSLESGGTSPIEDTNVGNSAPDTGVSGGGSI